MPVTETVEDEARGAAMGAAHHAYCRDTGCFDGDDISNPEIAAALEDVRLAARLTLLRDLDLAAWHPTDGRALLDEAERLWGQRTWRRGQPRPRPQP